MQGCQLSFVSSRSQRVLVLYVAINARTKEPPELGMGLAGWFE